MAWDEIKREARLAVHAEFGISATYLPPDGAVGVDEIPVTVRYHTRIARQGAIEDVGFAAVAEDVNQLVFLQSEVNPERGATITVLGIEFAIDYTLPPDDDTVVAAEVRRVTP